ncbi:amidohydrolase family protein [Saccharomonospora piscinae]|uniref:amidohydrolase family protein n=1 Tax=Saccharomonospora piscinae TaxID=687388 RepID=UPI000463DA13|nr:amidohydrolase family protein [Saccharomonospora piscinae]
MGTVDRRSFLAWLSTGAVAAATLGRGGSLAVAEAERGATAGEVLVLRGATVFDGTGTGATADTTVVCASGRIVAVGRGLPGGLPAGARVVDCSGAFVIPGLWDAHTHSTEITPTVPALHLVHGVTGVREMRGSPATHEVRRRIERGTLAGPRMVVASNTLDGPDSRVPGATLIETDDDAREAANAARQEGADLLKVYSFLPRDQHTAIARHADRVGLPFAGHSPSLLPVHEVIRRGQRSVEHNYGMHLSTSVDAEDYFARLAALPDEPTDPNWWGRLAPLWEREAFRTYDRGRAGALAGLFAEHGAWHVPTLAVESAYARHPTRFLDDDQAQERARRWLPASLREQWRARVQAWPEWSPERAETELAYLDARLRLVADLAEDGAPVAAGTDCGSPYVFPGVAVHDELALLVRAGLSPARALRAATRDAARCAGIADAGTVVAGAHADLVVLDADPLADIGNSRAIRAVVTRGAYLGPTERQRLFDEIERAADGSEAPQPAGPAPASCCGPPPE